MIIIETKNGPFIINEREAIGCSFDKAKAKAVITFNRDIAEEIYPNGECKVLHPTVEYNDVECVRYVSDSKPTEYMWEGSEVERQNRIIADLHKRNDTLKEAENKLVEKLHRFACDVLAIVDSQFSQMPKDIRVRLKDMGEKVKSEALNWHYPIAG